jgi:hypothetical protein
MSKSEVYRELIRGFVDPSPEMEAAAARLASARVKLRTAVFEALECEFAYQKQEYLDMDCPEQAANNLLLEGDNTLRDDLFDEIVFNKDYDLPDGCWTTLSVVWEMLSPIDRARLKTKSLAEIIKE